VPAAMTGVTISCSTSLLFFELQKNDWPIGYSKIPHLGYEARKAIQRTKSGAGALGQPGRPARANAQSIATITSDALMTADADCPLASLSSSTASLVIKAVTTELPISMRTCRLTFRCLNDFVAIGRHPTVHKAGDCRSEGSSSMYPARSRCCLASTNGTELRLLGCCKPVPHPLQCMPEKHLARQGVFGLLCGVETVLGVVLAQLYL
jgi:hypothetical protein